tara:strand:+ start:113 stop:238 length:126 start_codon:yes stop_codon:yes gene_type:complete
MLTPIFSKHRGVLKKKTSPFWKVLHVRENEAAHAAGYDCKA